MQNEQLVSLDEITVAFEQIRDKIHRTPMMRSAYFSQKTDTNVFLKLELFQKTGSFKVRGISNCMATLSEEERKRGVITVSAGNAAQAVAWSAAQFDVPSTVVMPSSSVPTKQRATRDYGGEVLLTDGDLLSYMREVQAARGLTLVHPFDDLNVIAGHGSLGIEILEDVPKLDAIFVGVGGGGLISGIAAAVKAKSPTTKIIGVEPEGAPTIYNSLKHGEPRSLQKVTTIADGLAAPFAGQHTFQHVKTFVDAVILVSDDEIRAALRDIWGRCKVVAEPAACAPVAGLLSKKIVLNAGENVCCVICGGNIDLDNAATLLKR